MIKTNVSVNGGQGVNNTLRKLMARVADAGKVYVGVQKSAGTEPDGFPLAPLAAIQHYGSSNGRIPPRPFLDVAVEGNEKTYSKIMGNDAAGIMDGTINPDSTLNTVGMRAAGDVQQYMVDLRTPPNAARTIADKGSANPLIDKGSANPLIDEGNLRQSITHAVEKE